MTLPPLPWVRSDVSGIHQLIASIDFINVEHLTIEEVRQVSGLTIQA